MGNGVVKELGRREKLRPFVGIIGTEDPKVGLYLLIGSFRLAISLRMIRGETTNTH
jgi:hypothetical protein